MPLVSCSGLRFLYGSGLSAVLALESIDLTIEEGEVLAVVGPSGCGKSTLLKCILGLIEPTGGSLKVAGEHPSEARRNGRFSTVFQDTCLLDWLSVRQNVLAPLRLESNRSRLNEAEARADSLLDLTGLREFSNFKPSSLSGGMKQRVSIARALISESDIVLLDEPLGALDILTRARLTIELALWLSNRQTTAVIVTHSVEEAVFLADRVAIMSSRPGRIVAVRDVPKWSAKEASLFELDDFLHTVSEYRHVLMEAWK